MKRFFFLVPDLKTTQVILDDLKTHGIEESHVHVVGEKSDDIEKAHVKEATLIQTSDLLPSLKRGALMGLAFSIILCALYYFILEKHFGTNPLIFLGLAAFGLIFGCWASSLIGVSVENPIIEKFDDYVKDGHYIMMVDTTSSNEIHLTNKLVRSHPGTKIAGYI